MTIMERFTKSKTMVFPREIIVGHHSINEIGPLCQRLDAGEHVLIVNDKITKRICGNTVEKQLQKAGYNVDNKLIAAPTLTEVAKIKKEIEKNDIEMLLGVGGGSVIDVTKLASFEMNRPFISVPTCASHDGIASPQASLKDRKGNVSRRARSPDAVLADTAIICKAPFRMIASGCADVLSNISAVLDWKLASNLKDEEFSSHAAVLATTSAELIMEHADQIKSGAEKSAWFAVKAMIVSGVAMSVAGSTRPASGAEHMFSHMLDYLGPGIMLKGKSYKKPLHGEQCGIGAIMMLYLHGGDWQSMKRTLQKIGCPTTSEELGVSKKKIVEALTRCQEIRPERYTILGETGLTEKAATKLAKKTGVI